LSSLLELDEGETERALCSRVVAARGEVIEKGHTVEQALYGRDALSKVRLDYACLRCEKRRLYI
jgi:myosin-1